MPYNLPYRLGIFLQCFIDTRRPAATLATGTKMAGYRICLALSPVVGVIAVKLPVSESNTAQ